MDIQSIAQERLQGPEWTAFLEGLDIAAADRAAGEEAFWRAVDYSKAPLFDGLADDDAEAVETAVQAELNRRGLATPGDFEP